MKQVLLGLMGLVMVSCNHVTPKPDAVSQVLPPVEYYDFKVVTREVPQKRVVNSAKKTPVVTQEKYLQVSACVESHGCSSPDKNTYVPYDRFVAQVKEELKADDKIIEKQEQYLEKSLEVLKSEQNLMQQEHAYYNRQLKLFKWSSLKPVVDGHKKAQEVVARDIKMFQVRILKVEEELKFIKRKNGVRLSQEESLQLLMELMASGYSYPEREPSEQDQVWKLFQKMGQHFVYNPEV